MDFFSDEELDNIMKMANKYFNRQKFRKLIVMRNSYLLIDRVSKLFKREPLLPKKYDNLFHQGITDAVTEFVNSREAKDLFHKIFLISMRNYDFVVVLFLKREIPNYDYEMYNLGYIFLTFFLTVNEEEFEPSEKQEGIIAAGIEPIYFTMDF